MTAEVFATSVEKGQFQTAASPTYAVVNAGMQIIVTHLRTSYTLSGSFIKFHLTKNHDAVLADSDIMQHYPYTFDESRVKKWIEVNIERYRVFGFGLWTVILKNTGEMIGDCGLTMQNINGFIRPEIGYHVRADKQKNGYAKEAASAVRDWTFSNTPFKVFYSYMKSANVPSAKTAEAVGMHLVDTYIDPEGERTSVYALERQSAE